jgi:hypothetical protein
MVRERSITARQQNSEREYRIGTTMQRWGSIHRLDDAAVRSGVVPVWSVTSGLSTRLALMSIGIAIVPCGGGLSSTTTNYRQQYTE